MTERDRKRREANEARQSPALPSEGRAPAVTRTWLIKGTPAGQVGVVWIKRPMPDGQWPPDRTLARDDSFSWWVRSHCGHEGGAKQWAFYDERSADQVEQAFRGDPCRYTRCTDRLMIENDGRRPR